MALASEAGIVKEEEINRILDLFLVQSKNDGSLSLQRRIRDGKCKQICSIHEINEKYESQLSA
jgi:hypothetical protein